MKVKYEDRLKQKVIAITTDTLVVGVDITKNCQWARFVDFRGTEHKRALKFKNSRDGFKTILVRIREICKEENFAKAVVGMEPTGHCWKLMLEELSSKSSSSSSISRSFALTAFFLLFMLILVVLSPLSFA